MEKELSIAGLYYRYKKTTDDEIREQLSKIKLVKKQHKGVNSVYGYYPVSEVAMQKILEKPRNVSLTFDATETADAPIEGLTELKTITYLVKSTSRFFLKPDVGEIFDQINYHDLLGDKIKAICYNEDSDTLEGTDGEHFLMTATLLH